MALEVFELDGLAALTQAHGGEPFVALAVNAVVEEHLLAVHAQARAVVAVEVESVITILRHDERALEDEAEGGVACAKTDVEETARQFADGFGLDEREVGELVPRVAVVAELQIVEVARQGGVRERGRLVLGEPITEQFLQRGDAGLHFVAATLDLAHPDGVRRLLRFRGEQCDFIRRPAIAVVVHVLEEREQAVVVLLRDGVDFVVMAARAIHGEAEECLAGRRYDVVEAVVAGQLAVGGFVVPDAEAVEAGGNQGVGVGRGKFVTGELLAEEAVVGLVAVEGADDVVAEAPGVGLVAVALVAVALGETHEVEPVAAPLLAIARRVEQAVNQLLPCARRFVGGKRLHLGGRRGQAGQVVVGAANQFARGGGRVQGKVLRSELGENEGVNRISDC